LTDIEQIEQYLSGELNAEQRQSFEQRLHTDHEFAETFKIYQAIEEEMTTDNEDDLRNELGPHTSKYFESNAGAKVIPINRKRQRWWMYATAAAASIVILLLWKPWADKKLSNEELYAKNAVPENLPSFVRGSNNDSLLINASEAFNRKDYAAAKPLLDSISKLRPTEAQLQLADGIANTETANYNIAIEKFDVLAAGQSIYKYDAMFWKGLTFLKQGKKDECIAALKLIPADASNYKKATGLIERLGG